MPGEEKPTFYLGVLSRRPFPSDAPDALDEFLCIQYPEFDAPENEQVERDALAVLLGEIGPAVTLTHSSTGIRGWITGTNPVTAFDRLTTFPIQIVWGDYVRTKLSSAGSASQRRRGSERQKPCCRKSTAATISLRRSSSDADLLAELVATQARHQVGRQDQIATLDRHPQMQPLDGQGNGCRR